MHARLTCKKTSRYMTTISALLLTMLNLQVYQICHYCHLQARHMLSCWLVLMPLKFAHDLCDHRYL
jgi:hypothetical protein